MFRPLVALALVSILGLVPLPARADQAASFSNVLGIEQAIDIATTQSILRHGGYEGDPLAAPFACSVPKSIAVAAGLNILSRVVGKKFPVPVHFIVYAYPLVLANNIGVIQDFHYQRTPIRSSCRE